jgi:hypothetical protein
MPLSPEESRRAAAAFQDLDPHLQLKAAAMLFEAGSIQAAPGWVRKLLS